MIPFSPPYINQAVIDEVVDSLRSGWITTGPKVKALEGKIADHVGLANVLCINSWTSGAIMMLKWLGLTEGDEVIVPAYTYSATAMAVIHAGGTPVMVDVGEDFNIDPSEIEKAITPRTKAIIPVDFSGYPCDYKEINDIVRKKSVAELFVPSSPVQEKLGRIMVLSDAAHSLGAKYLDKPMGSCADITIFSLHAVKNVTTAEGGAIVLNMPEPFNNDELYSELKMMSLNCQTKDAFSKSKAGNWQYDIIGLGMKINMADINAAVGLAQMDEYSSLLEMRKDIFKRYLKGFKDHAFFLSPPMTSEYKESSCHLFPLRIKGITETERNQIIEEISKSGVSVNVHFIPMPMLTLFKDLGYKIEDYPVTYKNYAAEISLPIYPQLSIENVDYIINTVINASKKILMNDKANV